MLDKNSSSTFSGDKLAVSIGRNTLFGVVARVAQVSTRLVTVPIVIAHLGLGGYGIWAILMTTAAYLRFGSVGVKSAFQKYVAEASGSGDFETANKLLSTGCAFMLLVSAAGLLPIAFFSRKLALMAGVPPEFLTSSAHSFTMLAIIMVIANVGAVYEAIVMGGHRVDLARNFSTVFTIAEAVAIVVLLHFGAGLFAMAAVMAASEVGFIACCFVAAKKVVPQIRLEIDHVTVGVVGELVRFGGSYQLANVLQVLYISIVPVAVLRLFGADTSGIYALATRLVGSALMLPDALLVPILSGAAMIFACGSIAEIRTLIHKAFKVTLVLALFPLAFTAMFGSTIVLAWTGATDPSLNATFWLVCVAGLFQSFSTLGLVLYRASGQVLFDNVRLVTQIVILTGIALEGHRLGFLGVLGGLALAELFGAVFMFFAIHRMLEDVRVRSILVDGLRLTTAIAISLCVAGVSWLWRTPSANPRVGAVIQLGIGCVACLLAAWPSLAVTKSLTRAESRTIVSVFLPKRCGVSHERSSQLVEVR